jgi:Lrp/AsnC family transcriptional regulator for asnA, asnC and gidA
MTDFLNSKDVEILKALRNDCRKPMGLVGESVGISKATVSRRVSKLEEDGIIKSYDLNVDSNKLGIMKSLVFMQIVGSPAGVVIEQLQAYKEIATIYKSFGDHNIVCVMYTRSVDELYDVIQTKLLKMPSVRNVEVDILLEGMDMNENADLKLFEKSLKD